jgi:5-methylcytosine-specific restriction enzyme A
VLVNAYERSSSARAACLAHYGHACSVCGFDFEKTYGLIGKDFIHVHHLKEISAIAQKYQVDPIQDLRPVCPNCHAMLHQRKPAYSIDELKQVIVTMP